VYLVIQSKEPAEIYKSIWPEEEYDPQKKLLLQK
jgi:hypothetical protein